MKLCKTNLLYLIFIFCLLSCTNNNLSLKENHYFEKNDSISFLYNKAKDDSFLINERLNFVDNAERLSLQLSDSASLINMYSLKNAIYSKTNFTDSTLLYAKKMLDIANLKQDTSKIGKAYFKLAKHHSSQSRYDSAYYYFNLSKEKYLSVNDSSQVGMKLMAMGRILLDDDDYYESETTLVEALKYLSPIKDKKHIAIVYHTLSMASRKQFSLNKALEQINKAIKLNNSEQNHILYINSKSLTLRDLKEFDKSILLYKDLLKNKLVLKDKKEYARIIDNLGYTEWLSNNTTESYNKLIKALKIRKSENDVQGLIASNSHLMKYFSKKNKLKAIEHANDLYKLTVEQNNIEDRLDALTYLRNLSSIQESKAYSDIYIKIKDSITEERNKAKNKYAAIRYDSTEDREKALKLEAENAEKDLKSAIDQNQKLLLAILLIIASSIGFLINRYRKQQTKIARIEERHTTQNRLSKKLHDEVGNDLYYLLLQLQKISGFTNDQENLKILHGFDSLYHKVRDFSRDHKIETGEEYGDELLSLLDAYGDQKTKVVTSDLEHDFWKDVTPTKKEELYWVLKELLTNMKRHSKANIVAVTFTKEKKQIVINYVDNGVGVDLEQPISKNGLHNVKNRIKDINGTITFDTKPKEGFKATIVFAP